MNVMQLNVPYLVSDDFLDQELFTISTITAWFTNVSNYLVSGKLPQNLSTREKHNIIQQSANYSWINGDLLYTEPDLIMRRCVRENMIFDVLKACHSKPCGGNFVDKKAAYKFLHTGYYWPSLFKMLKSLYLVLMLVKGWGG